MQMLWLPLTMVMVTAYAAPPSVAVTDFTIVGADARLGSVYAERLATRLDNRGFKVMTQQTLQSLLSVERQKQLLGCSEEASSCVAELAGALGSTYLMLGQVAKVGSSFTVNVRAVRSADGSTQFSTATTVGSEEAALTAVSEAADAFVYTVDPSLAKPNVVPWVVAAVGAATAGAGAVFMVRVAEANAVLRGPVRDDLSVEAAFALSQARAPEQTIGISLIAVGGTALVSGIVWWALSRSPKLNTASTAPTGRSWLAYW